MFDFLFDAEVSEEEVKKQILSASKAETFLKFVLSFHKTISLETKHIILVACIQVSVQHKFSENSTLLEIIDDICRAFGESVGEDEAWINVLIALVNKYVQGRPIQEDLILKQIRDVQYSLQDRGMFSFAMPLAIVDPSWKYFVPDTLPSDFNAFESAINQDFCTKSIFPEKILGLLEMNTFSRKDRELIALFFTSGITLERITEVFISQDMDKEGKLISTYLKLDPTDPEKKVFNFVKRVEPAKKAKTVENE